MVRAKNYETVLKFVKVMPKKLVASFSTQCRNTIGVSISRHATQRAAVMEVSLYVAEFWKTCIMQRIRTWSYIFHD